MGGPNIWEEKSKARRPKKKNEDHGKKIVKIINNVKKMQSNN